VVDDGLSLAEVLIAQGRSPGREEEKKPVRFPVLIPYQTMDLPKGARLPLGWAGIRLSKLIRGKGSNVKPSGLLTSVDLRERLRVSPETRVLALLNGRDDRLAALWGMNRSEMYSAAERHGIEAITGPTFSISSEQEGEPRTPAAQNVIMQKRHHQVLAEIAVQTTAIPIPNIYWRDRRDWQKWAEWMETNQVRVVSRDFSMTTQSRTFRRELAGLVQVLNRVDRTIHVLVVGVGMAKAKWTIRRLAAEGHTCSIVTSDPIHTGAAKGKRMVQEGGEICKVESDEPLSRLGAENLDVAEAFLYDITSELPPYRGLRTRNRALPKQRGQTQRNEEPARTESTRPAVTPDPRRPGKRAPEQKP
jgi:hypothetical protein